MADAFANIVEVLYSLIFQPFTDVLVQGCGRVSVCRGEMVERNNDPARIPYFFYFHFPEGLYCKDACSIMGHGVVYVRYDKIVCFGLDTCCTTKYLFTNSTQKNNPVDCNSYVAVCEYETGYSDIKSPIEVSVGE